jgi:hypothetical protein
MKFLNTSNVLSFLIGSVATATICVVALGSSVDIDATPTEDAATADYPSEGSFEKAVKQEAPTEASSDELTESSDEAASTINTDNDQ